MARHHSRAALLLHHAPLMAYCLATVIVIRIALFIFPYKRIARWMPEPKGPGPTRDEMRRLLWGVRCTARIVPRASCLTQALASHYLCARAGHPTAIRIGVAREPDGNILAHAWLVDSTGTLTNGGTSDLSRFKQIAELGGPLR
jgi:hypothetical protein